MLLVGYIRTCAGEHYNRIETQDTLLHRFCKLYPHHRLVDIFVDKGISAATPFEMRKGGHSAITLLRSGIANGLLMTDLNRAFNLNLSGLLQEQWFDKHRCAILTILDGIDTSYPDGWRTFACKMIGAEYTQRQQRWQDKHGSAETDKPKSPAYIPFGCVAPDQTRHPGLYRDPVLWQIREIIMELHQQNIPQQRICEYLQQEQIPAPNGERIWHSSTVAGLIESYDKLQRLPELPGRRKCEGTVAS